MEGVPAVSWMDRLKNRLDNDKSRGPDEEGNENVLGRLPDVPKHTHEACYVVVNGYEIPDIDVLVAVVEVGDSTRECHASS